MTSFIDLSELIHGCILNYLYITYLGISSKILMWYASISLENFFYIFLVYVTEKSKQMNLQILSTCDLGPFPGLRFITINNKIKCIKSCQHKWHKSLELVICLLFIMLTFVLVWCVFIHFHQVVQLYCSAFMSRQKSGVLQMMISSNLGSIWKMNN